MSMGKKEHTFSKGVLSVGELHILVLFSLTAIDR